MSEAESTREEIEEYCETTEVQWAGYYDVTITLLEDEDDASK